MGLFAWLLGRRERKSQLRPLAADDEKSGPSTREPEFIDIKARRFLGQCVKSSNKRFTLAWRDGNGTVVTNGVAKSVGGRYLLLEGDRVLVDGKMVRPNDGRVANNGVFVLNDWGRSEALSGTFRAFDAQGRTLMKKKFSANLLNNGVADDGRLAVCQTCNSPSADSAILTVFDLTIGSELARWSPASGWADYYLFPDNDVVQLGYRDLGAFSYTLDGQFIDRERWEEAKLAKGDLLLIETILKEIGGHPEGELLEKLLRATEVALASPNAHPQSQALGLKLRGICLEARGAMADALDSYDKAIVLNPKVGVKQRADRLRKSIAKAT